MQDRDAVACQQYSTVKILPSTVSTSSYAPGKVFAGPIGRSRCPAAAFLHASFALPDLYASNFRRRGADGRGTPDARFPRAARSAPVRVRRETEGWNTGVPANASADR